jgi:hypothetical protein
MQFAALFHQNDDFAYSLKCIDKAFVYLDKRKDSNDPLDLIICGLMFSENFPAADSFFDRALNLMNFKNHENKNHLKEILVLYREIEEYLNSHTNESLTAQFNGLQTKLFVSIGDYASEGMDEAEYIYYIMQPAALFYQNDDFAFALKCMDSYIKRPLIVSEATTNKLVSNVPALKVLAVIYRENKMNKECIDILNTLESIYISLTERTGEKYGEDLELTKSIKQEVNEAIK